MDNAALYGDLASLKEWMDAAPKSELVMKIFEYAELVRNKERERCATVAEDLWAAASKGPKTGHFAGQMYAAMEIAAEIRRSGK